MHHPACRTLTFLCRQRIAAFTLPTLAGHLGAIREPCKPAQQAGFGLELGPLLSRILFSRVLGWGWTEASEEPSFWIFCYFALSIEQTSLTLQIQLLFC